MEYVDEPFKDGSNPENNTNCGWDGESGENCGTIYIRDTIKVYAYGGAGGSGGNGISSSGGGRRRISSSRNRRRPEPEVAADIISMELEDSLEEDQKETLLME